MMQIEKRITRLEQASPDRGWKTVEQMDDGTYSLCQDRETVYTRGEVEELEREGWNLVVIVREAGARREV